jgi:hypothetical protein
MMMMMTAALTAQIRSIGKASIGCCSGWLTSPLKMCRPLKSAEALLLLWFLASNPKYVPLLKVVTYNQLNGFAA